MHSAAVETLQQILSPLSPYQVTFDDEKLAQRNKLQFLMDKISRKKFRRRPLAENTRQQIEQRIKKNLAENQPIHFVIPFGGYKHFWNSSHPEPDWAEIFNLRFIAEYVSALAAVHKPGVIVEYISEDMILTRMNNYPAESLEKYSEIFRQLIELFNTLTPKNIEFRFFRVSDRYDKNKIIQKVEAMLPERKKAFAQLSAEQTALELHRSQRSLMWAGELDLTNLSEAEKQDRIVESRLIELAYYETEAQPEFLSDYLGAGHICICFSFGLSHDNVTEDLTLGSTYSSVVDFWIGRGVLEFNGSKYTPRIVSRQQYEDAAEKLEKIEGDFPSLPFKNYRSVEIIKL